MVAIQTGQSLAASTARQTRNSAWTVIAFSVMGAVLLIIVAMAFRSDEDKRKFRLKENAEYVISNLLAFPETAEVTIEKTTDYKPKEGMRFGSVKFEGTVRGKNAFNVPIRKSWTLTYDGNDVPSGLEFSK